MPHEHEAGPRRTWQLLPVMGIALSLHLSTVPAVRAAVTELRVATIASERVVHVRAVLVPWLKEVEAATGGRLRMRLLAGGMLGRDPGQQHWLVRTGVADVGWFTLAYEHGRFPALEHATHRIDAADAVEASARLYEAARMLWPAGTGTRPLAIYFSPPYVLHLAAAPDPGGSLAGRRIRIIDRATAALVAALGGIPVTGIAPMELGDALARGVIDGALLSWHAVGPTGVLAASRVHLEGPFGMSVAVLAARRRSLEALPDDLAGAVNGNAGRDLSVRHAAALCRAAAAAREQALSRGDIIRPVSGWERRVPPGMRLALAAPACPRDKGGRVP